MKTVLRILAMMLLSFLLSLIIIGRFVTVKSDLLDYIGAFLISVFFCIPFGTGVAILFDIFFGDD